jgi:DNA polymerase
VQDAELRLVAEEIRGCIACPLHRSARQAVPGEGTGESGIFFLGEAPGYHEDVQGKPFVGAAGQFLDELLAGIGLDRRKVFITNVVRHRPPENRDPLPDEITACDAWLRRHLALLRPRVIVTLGRHAMSKFFVGESISRIHGKPRKTADGLVVFPVYHPAAALHQPALRDALVADFAALALFLATAPVPREAEPRAAEQITLFG